MGRSHWVIKLYAIPSGTNLSIEKERGRMEIEAGIKSLQM